MYSVMCNRVYKIVNMLNFNDSDTCRNNVDLPDTVLLNIFYLISSVNDLTFTKNKVLFGDYGKSD